MKIATLTLNPALDMSSEVDEIVPNEKLRCEEPRYEPGGGGINVSRAICRLGGESVAVYTAGGQTGAALHALLDSEGVRADPIEIEGTTNESFAVLEQKTGDQFRFTMPGPRLTEAEWRGCLDEMSSLSPSPEFVVASGSLPRGVPDDFHARLADVATEHGARLVVDTSGEALRRVIEQGAFIVKPNIRELGQCVREHIPDSDAAEEAAKRIIAETPTEALVVSLGHEGAMLVHGDGEVHRFPSPDVEVRSRIGAGDSMVGGMTHALAQGWSLVEAVRFGVATGAAAVMTPGTELCRREDAERIYGELRDRVS